MLYLKVSKLNKIVRSPVKSKLVYNFLIRESRFRLQSDAFESELKVRQKERVPSRYGTRLWLYGLHGRVQSEAFRFNLEFISGASSS